MNQEKYQKVKVIVDNVTEENADTKFKMIILLIKNSFFEGNTSSPEELWFEKDLFKRDTDYYLAIISTINVFIKYCSKEKDFQIPSFENEIDHIYSTKKLSKAYVNLNNISKLLELDEGFYTKIYCAILSLGIKKESQINKILVESLREFAEDDRIKKSIYYQKIGEMDPCKTDMDEYYRLCHELYSFSLKDSTYRLFGDEVKRKSRVCEISEMAILIQMFNDEITMMGLRKAELDNSDEPKMPIKSL